MFTRLIKKHSAIEQLWVGNGWFFYEKGLVISLELEVFFSNAEGFDV